MNAIVDTLAELSDRYDAVFCDLWGCLHNGIEPFADAVTALQAFRGTGGKVVLLTNSPKPRAGVEAQLAEIGVPRDAWDVIATSGDSARLAMFQGAVGTRVYFIGEERDLPFFEPLHLLKDCPRIERVELAEAEGIVCTGPFDPLADPDTMRPDFLYAKQKNLKLLCANPDIVVDKGETRQWCAGALARLYTEMGGTSLYFGKPHPPVYDLARRRLAALGASVPDSRILAVGDGILTDIQGALGEDIDSLFITGGLAAAETRTNRDPDPTALAAYISEQMIQPTYSIGFLR
ncbi:MAG: TIGR01459 family HAD-type hydrolase [Rhodobacteraceae bacterium]|nr:TIGR01459 family HAD-type hydrolase [Paracoccaceae bacterium]